ncbi:hypothetical protein [Marinoscillum sp. MHG1-6]|uniref:hypothetical protein n=1 Tax=Marinoscillum sp. MHG1-6 TaxID=2959627 RepID=UPI002157CB93|nr:hypothetical protein [Marinoscillum sp. MHG1-6]
MNRVRINQGRILSGMYILGILLLTLFLIALSFNYLPELLAIPVVIMLGLTFPMVWSSFYIIEIDTQSKTISEYIWIMTFKINVEVTRFDSLEKIFVNQVGLSQNYHQYSGAVHEVRSREFQAYIKIDTGEKFYLVSGKNKGALNKSLNSIAQKLKVPVIWNE